MSRVTTVAVAMFSVFAIMMIGRVVGHWCMSRIAMRFSRVFITVHFMRFTVFFMRIAVFAVNFFHPVSIAMALAVLFMRLTFM